MMPCVGSLIAPPCANTSLRVTAPRASSIVNRTIRAGATPFCTAISMWGPHHCRPSIPFTAMVGGFASQRTAPDDRSTLASPRT
jgi:hypothetical protein